MYRQSVDNDRPPLDHTDMCSCGVFLSGFLPDRVRAVRSRLLRPARLDVTCEGLKVGAAHRQRVGYCTADEM